MGLQTRNHRFWNRIPKVSARWSVLVFFVFFIVGLLSFCFFFPFFITKKVMISFLKQVCRNGKGKEVVSDRVCILEVQVIEVFGIWLLFVTLLFSSNCSFDACNVNSFNMKFMADKKPSLISAVDFKTISHMTCTHAMARPVEIIEGRDTWVHFKKMVVLRNLMCVPKDFIGMKAWSWIKPWLKSSTPSFLHHLQRHWFGWCGSCCLDCPKAQNSTQNNLH